MITAIDYTDPEAKSRRAKVRPFHLESMQQYHKGGNIVSAGAILGKLLTRGLLVRSLYNELVLSQLSPFRPCEAFYLHGFAHEIKVILIRNQGAFKPNFSAFFLFRLEISTYYLSKLICTIGICYLHKICTQKELKIS